MKLNEESCKFCLRVTSKDAKSCPYCGHIKPTTLDQKWLEGFATVGKVYPIGTVHPEDL